MCTLKTRHLGYLDVYVKNTTLVLLRYVHYKNDTCVTKMLTLKTRKCDVIWLMNFNILLKFSANIKDYISDVKEKLSHLMSTVEKSTEQG